MLLLLAEKPVSLFWREKGFIFLYRDMVAIKKQIYTSADNYLAGLFQGAYGCEGQLPKCCFIIKVMGNTG